MDASGAHGSSLGLHPEPGPRALVLQHDAAAGAGLIDSWLADRGIAAELVNVPAHGSLPDPSTYALVISLGSESGVNESLRWARDEEALLRQAHTAGTPVLGVCFGAQLLAHALGGEVDSGVVCEIGWQTLHSSRPMLIAAGPWFQWHFDSLLAPPHAEVIAESEAGVEAFLCESSLGLQFHPEVTPAIVGDWIHVYRSELDAHDVCADAILAATAASAAPARRRAYDLLDAFAVCTGLCVPIAHLATRARPLRGSGVARTSRRAG